MGDAVQNPRLVEEVAAFLMKHHAEKLRGPPGPIGMDGDMGERGDPGQSCECRYVVERLVTQLSALQLRVNEIEQILQNHSANRIETHKPPAYQ